MFFRSRRPSQRTPLWQQRQRAADLLAVAAKYPTFPILLETSRECIQDVFDVPALAEVLTQLHSRSIALVTVDTPKPSPFAQSLLFNWIATYMYEGDAPLAERRAAALSLDRDLLNDLLGTQELRELLDPQVLIDVECELQCLVESRQAGPEVVGGMPWLVGQPMDAYEKYAIQETLKLTGGNREEAAKILEIGARTLYRKLEKYQLE